MSVKLAEMKVSSDAHMVFVIDILETRSRAVVEWLGRIYVWNVFEGEIFTVAKLPFCFSNDNGSILVCRLIWYITR